MSKKYLIIGSGGREHALARSIGKYAECFVLPGNPGMVQDAQIISGNASDFEFVAGKAKELNVSAVV
ncbi:MAG: phosphoribosylamine--glycine ligase, partial [Caldisericia bacterium]|nr:phosphoribosylamine--glycine ligase [Caldisericia bacterium]